MADQFKTDNVRCPRLLMVCEGETEVAYFREVARQLGISKYIELRLGEGTEPLGLVRQARRDLTWAQAGQGRWFSEAWVICDRDTHPHYVTALAEARDETPTVNVCWSNPCIEFWFWLHFSKEVSLLPCGSTIELERKEYSRECEDNIIEFVQTKRCLRIVHPQTMLNVLLGQRPDYKKARYLPGLIQRTGTALDNFNAASQSSNPNRMGTAIPLLLKRLLKLQEEVTALPKNVEFQETVSAKELLPQIVEFPDRGGERGEFSLEYSVALCAAIIKRIGVRPNCFVMSPEDVNQLRKELDYLVLDQTNKQVRYLAEQAKTLFMLILRTAPHLSFPTSKAASINGHLTGLRRTVEELTDFLPEILSDDERKCFDEYLFCFGIFKEAAMVEQMQFVVQFALRWAPGTRKAWATNHQFNRFRTLMPMLYEAAKAKGAAPAQILTDAVGHLNAIEQMCEPATIMYPVDREEEFQRHAQAVSDGVRAFAEAMGFPSEEMMKVPYEVMQGSRSEMKTEPPAPKSWWKRFAFKADISIKTPWGDWYWPKFRLI